MALLARIFSKAVQTCIRWQNGRGVALRVMTVAILVANLGSADLFGQAGTNASSQLGNRYLFVVETSRAMQGRARGIFNAVKQALDSGLSGKIRQGDTVGIW